MAERTDHGDPLWDMRRVRVDWCLKSALGLSLLSLPFGPSMAAAVIPAMGVFALGVMGLYMGVAEWGRINGVLDSTTVEEEVVESPGSPPITTTKKTEKTTDPAPPAEGE